MLRHLSIRNIVIIEHLELDFKPGMTVLTGETGAGKSILMEALGFTLGERSDKTIIRQGADFAEVIALYDLLHLPKVMDWLAGHHLLNSDNSDLNPAMECIIRRVLTKDGRNKCFINGTLVPVNQLKELSEQLVNIHGQHQNQALLRPDQQRYLLDEYANHPKLLESVASLYQEWLKLQKEWQELKNQENQQDRLNLLQYQIEELNELNLKENEVSVLEMEYKNLAHAEQRIKIISDILSTMQYNPETNSNDYASPQSIHLLSALDRAIQNLNSFQAQHDHPSIKITKELFNNAHIQIEEAIAELNNYQNTLTIDPKRLHFIDERLSHIHTLARKHKIAIEELYHHHTYLKADMKKLQQQEERLQKIQSEIEQLETAYLAAAKKLSISRQKSASELEQKVTHGIQSLEMPKGKFSIEFKPKDNKIGSQYGIDEIEFLVCTNPGQSLLPLRKVASGGELSRISLSIQVITAEKMTTPTLIFDEVDVGISGKTAAVVGKLMKRIGESTQVLCVTHLPQVAASAHQHFSVIKNQLQDKTMITVENLDSVQKITEIARMLGGAEITDSALIHAKTILETS